MLGTIESLVMMAIQIYLVLCIIYIFMSWFPNARETSFGRTVGRLVEPYLQPFRSIIPPLGMIDISPIVAIFALNFAMVGIGFIFDMLR